MPTRESNASGGIGNNATATLAASAAATVGEVERGGCYDTSHFYTFGG